MSTIYPTFTCFDDTIEFLIGRRTEHPKASMDLLVVHGICKVKEGPHAGECYAHGWVEEPALGVCWEAGFFDGTKIWYSVERSEYHTVRQVQEFTPYTIREMLRESKKARHYGPWKPEYLALTGDSHRVFGVLSVVAPTAPPR